MRHREVRTMNNTKASATREIGTARALRQASRRLGVPIARCVLRQGPSGRASFLIVLGDGTEVRIKPVRAMRRASFVRARLRRACGRSLPKLGREEWMDALRWLAIAAEKRPGVPPTRPRTRSALRVRRALAWRSVRRTLEARLGVRSDEDLALCLGVRTPDVRAWSAGTTEPKGPAARLVQVLLCGPRAFRS